MQESALLTPSASGTTSDSAPDSSAHVVTRRSGLRPPPLVDGAVEEDETPQPRRVVPRAPRNRFVRDEASATGSESPSLEDLTTVPSVEDLKRVPLSEEERGTVVQYTVAVVDAFVKLTEESSSVSARSEVRPAGMHDSASEDDSDSDGAVGEDDDVANVDQLSEVRILYAVRLRCVSHFYLLFFFVFFFLLVHIFFVFF